jgi:hypothetical protein
MLNKIYKGEKMSKILIMRLAIITIVAMLTVSCGGDQDETAGQVSGAARTDISGDSSGAGPMSDMSGMAGMQQEAMAVQDEIGQPMMSEQGLFLVTASPQQGPVPLNTMHSWVVHVETANGQIVDNAEISVAGGMPAHMHGMPTAPAVTRSMGNGDYLVEGMQFQMPGHWEVNLDIDASGQQDKVTFNFNLQP